MEQVGREHPPPQHTQADVWDRWVGNTHTHTGRLAEYAEPVSCFHHNVANMLMVLICITHNMRL